MPRARTRRLPGPMPGRVTALASPSPRGDLFGSLAIRFAVLRTLVPPPRSTPAV